MFRTGSTRSASGAGLARTGTAADLLAVGLGNPGAEYEHTRHNVGAEVIATLARRHGARLRATRGTRSLGGEVRLGERLLALAFPQTFMNDSGAAVAPLMRRHGISALGRLVVVHDELDLPSGRVKVKLGGGTAGHNGLRSIQAHVHGDGFVRVRIGIGKPPGRQGGVDYVLHAPRGPERALLDVAVEEAADAVEVILGEGVEAAMNRFNQSDFNQPGER
jgi:PTH1 family peptidyl-tRNA hydrolase